MATYKLVYKYEDGKIKEETDFDDERDFNESQNAIRKMILNKLGNLVSFQAYIDNVCVEDSEKMEYTVIRDKDNRIMAITMNAKENEES